MLPPLAGVGPLKQIQLSIEVTPTSQLLASLRDALRVHSFALTCHRSQCSRSSQGKLEGGKGLLAGLTLEVIAVGQVRYATCLIHDFTQGQE